MRALVECLKGTKEKYEVKIADDGLVFIRDRMLKKRWAESYGCIPHTLQADKDELDSYIIGKGLKQGDLVDVLPVCIIYTNDNGEADNKLVCVAKNARCIKYRVKSIVRFVKSYKKGSKVLSVSWKPENIRYELAKCKAYYNLFKGGTA